MLPNLSIVIPVYNEEDNIEKTLNILKNYLEQFDFKYEIICVNDCSTDKSREILEKIEDIKLINHQKNRGYGAAIKTGVNNSKYKTVATYDADGQHRPEDLINILKEFKDKNSMIIGARKIYQTKFNRIFGKLLIHKIAEYIFNKSIKDINSGLRVFNKNIASKYFHICSDRFSFSTSLTLSYIADDRDVYFIPIKVQSRNAGKSQVNYKAGLSTIMKILLLGMLYKPLKVILPFSLIFFILGIISFLYDLFKMDLSSTTIFLLSNSIIMFLFSLLAEQLNVIRMEIFLNEKKCDN